MAEALDRVKFPELVVGIAGPIGVDLDAIADSTTTALRAVGYRAIQIKLTDEMLAIGTPVAPPAARNFYNDTKFKMDYANSLCQQYNERSTIASIGIMAINNKRRSENEAIPSATEDTALEKTAFIIRQLKRPQEVDLFRKVYGKQFVLVSAYGPLNQRKEIIQAKLKRTLPMNTPSNEIADRVEYLIARDASEDSDFYGQHLRDTFHLADVFVDGINKQEMFDKLNRFVCALFGRTDIAPTKEEYGMYAATSAALRSSDLSRQVGAAIITRDGEIITQGRNEVPKALGGTYWDLETPDHRDVRLGSDPNEISKRELLRDLFERLSKAEMLSEKALALGNPAEMVDKLGHRAVPGDPNDYDGPLVGSEVLDLTEYGRVVHAEMCAICDAARLGRSVKGAILYCTTFPCHNCTKHIIAVGIKKVVYMEPYPKSRAKELHANEIDIEVETPGAVAFMPFLGISPFRYKDIFQKGRRKKPDGSAKAWYDDEPRPLIDIVTTSYIRVELFACANLIGNTRPVDSPPPAAPAS